MVTHTESKDLSLALLGELGLAGLIFETEVNLAIFVDTGNPAPFFTTGLGAGASFVILNTYGAPAALAFGAGYAIAGYYDGFDSDELE